MSAGADACPCGSGERYALCCGPLHGGRAARTAEQLMRSRYSAYVHRLEAYLLSTWHPSTRPASIDFEHDQTRWLGLTIRSREAGGPANLHGWISFRARYRLDNRTYRLKERSEFVRQDGLWVYLDGVAVVREEEAKER